MLQNIQNIVKICETTNIQTPGEKNKIPLHNDLEVQEAIVLSQVSNRLENTCIICHINLTSQNSLIDHFSKVHFKNNYTLVPYSSIAAYMQLC